MIQHTQLHLLLSSFYNYCLIAIFLLGGISFFPATSQAITLNALYFGDCQREVGVILHVGKQQLQLLTLKGTIQSIPRFSIIYLAEYPLSETPIQQINNADQVPLMRVETLFQNEIVELLRGWPIEFSTKSIAFLTTEGKEALVDVQEIWSVSTVVSSKNLHLNPASNSDNIWFEHPYPFQYCNAESVEERSNARILYPQQLFGEPLLIKEKLDILQNGYKRVKEYEQDQRFYGVPYVYQNKITLGAWLNFGSRYGASRSRENSFFPSLVSGLAEDVFGFQRQIITGSAPMPYSLHEEPQTQLWYHAKASYAHFSLMYDPSRLLIGPETYKWSKQEMASHDDRITEISHFGLGLNYKFYSIDLSAPSLQYAIRSGDHFFRNRMESTRVGLQFHNRFLKTQFYLITAKDEKPPVVITDSDSEAVEEEIRKKDEKEAAFLTKLNTYRLNTTFFGWQNVRSSTSLIYRKLDFRKDPLQGKGQFTYNSTSTTVASYIDMKLKSDLELSFYLAIELHNSKYGILALDKEKSSNFVKLGSKIALEF